MSLPLLREHTDSVIARLVALGVAVGDAEVPDGVGRQEDGTFVGYAVVYPIPGGGSTGTLADPDDDAFLIYQVTCVAESREQAQWLADRSLELLQGLQVPGRFIPRVGLDMHGGVQRDDQVDPPVFYSAPRFRITSTPA